MKKFLKYTAFVLITFAVIFALGPRPDTNVKITFNPANINENLNSYLKTAESDIDNLIDGAEKEIIWADPTAQSQTDIAIVYIHGFSATKHETRPVTDKIAEALEANVFYTRLKGHGRDGNGLAEASFQDWANDFAEAIAIGEKLGRQVIIISASTGSTLATWGLAKTELAKNIAGVVMISPNFELHGISTWLANIPWAENILPAVAGKERSWEPLNEQHGKWWTTRYPSSAIFPMTAMLKALKSVDKSKIRTPAFFIYSPNDKIIVANEAKKVAEQWGGPVKTMEIIETSDPFSHVIAGDILSPENTDRVTFRILEWLKQKETLRLLELSHDANTQSRAQGFASRARE